jgi:hypothetical protein
MARGRGLESARAGTTRRRSAAGWEESGLYIYIYIYIYIYREREREREREHTPAPQHETHTRRTSACAAAAPITAHERDAPASFS